VQAIEQSVAQSLGLVMKHLLRSTSREFFAGLEDAGISFTQVRCLGLLSDAGAPLPLTAVSEQIGLSLPAVSRAVDGLVKRGELKRAEDPADRRSKLVSVTARGRATYERLIAVRIAGLERFVDTLESDEREALAAAVNPIADRLGR
jgi:DNA-binding MarR family transcriptional regulator